jgi:tRNA1(Val) A37 N6-methylase TrmN6
MTSCQLQHDCAEGGASMSQGDSPGELDAGAISRGHLLDGRLRYAQPRGGFRTGIEPVLLAAAVPAEAGERVLEGGSGAGAALLCLAARVPGLQGVGVERDPALAALADGNAVANDFGGLRFIAADLLAAPPAPPFDHAMANPPYHPPAGTASPDARREAAKRAAPGLLAAWAQALGAKLRHRGTLTFILPAATLPEVLTAFAAAGCPAVTVQPLWPKQDRPARLILVRGVKGGRTPLQLLPGLVLHRPDGRFTAAAEAVLRGGAALT